MSLSYDTMDIILEREWEGLLDTLVETEGIAMILGETDSGKSTLARYLVERFVSRELPICLLDADVGQSSLGLPGTISMKIFASSEDFRAYTYETMCFVGTVNPAKAIALITSTVRRMALECGRKVGPVLVDTTGLVAGEVGAQLKISKIRALEPAVLIALQRERELEHILALASDIPTHRVPVSKSVKKRTLAVRIEYRRRKFEDYFGSHEMSDFLLSSRETPFLYRGKPFSPKHHPVKQKTLLGLNHGDDTVALGILQDVSDKSILFSAPLQSIKSVNRVVFGDLTYSSDHRNDL